MDVEVSVIVPVYNVECYLDECIESIVRQTFKNIEILLIVGDSTDNSTEKCLIWCNRDSRIIFIKEKQKGLGPARNQGIEAAKGKYIVFVDSDDWIKLNFIEKLYNAITTNNADMSECDFVRKRIYDEKGEVSRCSEMLGKQFSLKDRLFIGNVPMWKSMTKKELWTKYKIMQPCTMGEDMATYPLLLVYADKVVGVKERLYIYRKNRSENLSNQITSYRQINQAFEYLIQCFIDRKIYDKYKAELMHYMRRWMSRYLSPVLNIAKKKDYFQIRKSYLETYEKCFGEKISQTEILWGSFNLTRIVNKLNLLEDPYCRFQFSSFISIKRYQKKDYFIKHRNSYRAYMLKREFSDCFINILKEQNPKWFFFDLIEERHDIIYNESGYYTKSDAFDEAVVNIGEYQIIKRDTEECTKLWEESCKQFFKHLFENIDSDHVIMIENYLAENHGDGNLIEPYQSIEDIRKINSILNKYYAYIKKNYPNIRYVKAYEVDDYYTDNDYEYGCYPWHLNEWANIKIAEKIRYQLQEEYKL